VVDPTTDCLQTIIALEHHKKAAQIVDSSEEFVGEGGLGQLGK
jgi:hypothetical protein